VKLAMLARYPTRSLLRGGQRSLLALFCVAVGAMTIVGLRLVGGMVEDALVGNARRLNGGDVSVRTTTTPLVEQDLAIFADLRERGKITAYTAALFDDTQVTRPNGKRLFIQVRVVNPAAYPPLGPPPLAQTAGGDFRALLAEPGNAVVSQQLLEAAGLELGSTLAIKAGADHPRTFTVKIAGVLDRSHPLSEREILFTSMETYRRASEAPFGFNIVLATTPNDAAADEVKVAVRQRLPLAQVQTAAELLKRLEEQVTLIKRFLIVIGLLALLIGGVGIVNTMQVLLARRRIEIAMLKTAGYRRRDLYLLFGSEAALLGLTGGVLGAAAGVGVAAGLRALFERAFRLTLHFDADPGIVAGGVAVGLATALIFGLLPIVKAAGIRPMAVLRELPEERSFTGLIVSVALVLLLSVLFCVLAAVILGDVLWALAAVYGTFLLLALLSLGFRVLVAVLGRLPVPERYSLPFVLLVTLAVAVAAGLALVRDLRGVGVLLLVAALAGYVVVLLPRAWKISTKMALRNLGRAPGRTTTTLLALFIGVFVVGLVVVLGQGIREAVNGFIAAQFRYNVLALVPRDKRAAFDRALDGQPAVKRREANEVALSTQPTAINGQPIGPRLGHADDFGPDRISSQVAVIYLSGLEGFDLAHGQIPTPGKHFARLTAGRALDASDVGTNNVLLDDDLRKLPLKLEVGDRVTVLNPFTRTTATLTVVGFYKASDTGVSINLNPSAVFGPVEAARQLGEPWTVVVFSLHVDAEHTGQVTDALNEAVPDALVFNFGDLLAQFGQVLNDLLLMLTAIASLVLFAGIVIIANAVALAMLERRRELGILKATGYTSGRVLAVVLIENGALGGTGGLLGMMLVALATALFSRLAETDLGVSPLITIGLVVLVAVVAMLTAAVVAWQATRVRPLEVLRYE
jgi:ABC-type antimicrobial peptide transport system permease subunit